MTRSNAAAWPLTANSQGQQTLFQRLCLGLLLGLALLAAKPALADPPMRAGRVAEVVGDAWLFDAERREWVRLLRNQTVAEGDRLRTDERSRVSLRVGSTSLWVDERSDLEFTQLDEGRVLLQLARGDLGLRLRSPEAVAEYKVQTREGMSFAEREGLYRVEQLDRGSKVYALQGRLRFESGRGGDVPPVWLEGGEQAELWWANGPRAERQRLQGDSFSDWVLAQSRAEGDRLPTVTQRYVSPEMTGAEDLDRHGRWEQSPEYGAIWIPTVVLADWAPYRYGRWAWTVHWGWSWVDDAPWGFAPFHYGRWVHWGNRWCWAPGSYVLRPVYAPALVAWVGGGVSVGVSIGNSRPPPRYGWYPLAPREVYVPGYRHSPGYEHRLNYERDPVTVQRPHRNREVFGAVSYLPGQGGPARPMPVAELGPVRALPTAPARNELQGFLPQRPGNEASTPQTTNRPLAEGNGAGMPWRSENAGRRERERERDFAGPEPVRNAALPSQAGQVVNPNPNPGRPADLPWRGNREQEARQNPPQNQAVQPQPQQQPQQQPQAQQPPVLNNGLPQRSADSRERSWERNAERNQERNQERNIERRMEPSMDRSGPTRSPAFERQQERQMERPMERPMERQIERQPERARAMDLPQRAPEARPPSPPPAAPVAQQQQGPSRGEANGPPRRGGTEQDKR
ncbi:hypothetical protein HNP55_003967 [Paucibacter oligotrophus]|uniref:FecR family protein n=1 Tax=Roseateles oligotrophus TaxID=1769250 RepID=A0A840LJG4_9BURK|nr:DUF6600 domain-containing protein [Roseateles oligotrophus]MBB4845417.1 hypothetical protein [Roseateles oligotrophus]